MLLFVFFQCRCYCSICLCLSHCSRCLAFSLSSLITFILDLCSVFTICYLLSSYCHFSILPLQAGALTYSPLTLRIWFSATLILPFTSRLSSVITCLVRGCLKKVNPTQNVYFYNTTSLDDFCFYIIRLLTSYKLGVCPVTG